MPKASRQKQTRAHGDHDDEDYEPGNQDTQQLIVRTQGRKGSSSRAPPPPPPQASSSQETQILISNRVKNKGIATDSYLDITFFQTHFPKILEFFQFQKWTTFLGLNKPIYVQLVKEFYSFEDVQTNSDSSHFFDTHMFGHEFRVDEKLIKDVLKLSSGGLAFETSRKGVYENLSDAELTARVFRPGVEIVKSPRWPGPSSLTFDGKIISHIFSKIIFPQSSSINEVNVESAFYIACILEKRKLDLPHIIMNKMKESLTSQQYNLQYGSLITRIAESKNISVGGVALKKNQLIGKSMLKSMGITVNETDKILLWKNFQVFGPNFVSLPEDVQTAIYLSANAENPQNPQDPPSPAHSHPHSPAPGLSRRPRQAPVGALIRQNNLLMRATLNTNRQLRGLRREISELRGQAPDPEVAQLSESIHDIEGEWQQFQAGMIMIRMRQIDLYFHWI